MTREQFAIGYTLGALLSALHFTGAVSLAQVLDTYRASKGRVLACAPNADATIATLFAAVSAARSYALAFGADAEGLIEHLWNECERGALGSLGSTFEEFRAPEQKELN